ncbi:hypothetical protein OIU35_05205 [Boseaceae bacterium BT-24-1]|nr:hypothetical protein [Boseaceae bacterium BT-24-1]
MVATGSRDGWQVLAFFGVCTVVAVVQLWPQLLRSEALDADALLARFPGPVTLRSGRKRNLIMAAASAGFAFGIGALLQRADAELSTRVMLWAGVLLFGGGAPLLLLMAFKGTPIMLSADDLTLVTLHRRHAMRWADLSNFAAVRLPPAGTPMVAFDYGPADGTRLASANRHLIGRNSALPDQFDLAPAELALLLSSWRERALEAAPAPPSARS